MRKKIIWLGFIIGLFGIGQYFISGGFRPLASELEADLQWAIEEGYVIQRDDEVLNLIRMQEFYQNMQRGIEDEVVILINPSTSQETTFELQFSNDLLKMKYDIQINQQGRREYRMKSFNSILRILRRNRVEFLLIGEGLEESILSYRIGN